MKKIDYKRLFICILLTFLIGALPSIFINMKDTYSFLNKPILSPPSIVFPIVWSVLYLLLSISLYKISFCNDKKLIVIYFIQLILNSLWTVFFFGLNLRVLALIDLILLIVAVLVMLIKFKKCIAFSSYINIPYFIWLLFAFYLNLAIIIIN